MQKRSITLLLAALAMAGAAQAQDLRVSHAYARATVPHQPAGGAYLTIENTGKTTDKLVAASSPAAKTVELHTMSMEGNVMKMREVPAIELKPAEKLEMKPGAGYHLMLMGLRDQLKPGSRFPMTLQFEQAGKIEIEVSVQDKAAAGTRHGH